MLTKDFYFDLPEQLIAQHPSAVRGEDRLMVLNKADGKTADYMIEDLPDLIEEGSLMVFNNSKVRPSRCFAAKLDSRSVKPVEFLLIERLTRSQTEKYGKSGEQVELWRAMVKTQKQRMGNRYRFSDGTIGTIVESAEDEGTEFRVLEFLRSELMKCGSNETAICPCRRI